MTQAVLFLLAALVCVPIAVRLGLGSVLGYLLAGIALGPAALGLISDPQTILHVSELGVVLMLFLIGLELEPRRLWGMRLAVFGGGALQMAVCAGLIWPAGMLLGWGWKASLLGGLALALSSTAIVAGILQERRWMNLPLGRSTFAILLFQDIAAIPLLALAGALGGQAAPNSHGLAGVAGLPGWAWQTMALTTVVLAGRFVAAPIMRSIARMQVRELFTGFALLLVLGVAQLMEQVGLSMGLGAFLAGVLLASSEYKHALENDILPFKGLLLGLFFIAVGTSMDLALLANAPFTVLAALVLIVAIKAAGVWLLAPWAGLRSDQRALFGILLSQVGEFSFVVLSAGRISGVLPAAAADLLTLAAAMTMASTPLLLKLHGLRAANHAPARETDTMDDDHPSVILAGFGRYGQTVGRILLAAGVRTTVIDHDPDTVDTARRFGFKVYFGDATQPDLLQAAGIEHARVMVLAIDDVQQCMRAVRWLQHRHPQIRLVVRARDTLHAMDLINAGVPHVEREHFEASLRSARAALESLGHDHYPARQLTDSFRHYSRKFIHEARHLRQDQGDLIQRAREAHGQLEREIQADLQRQQHQPASGWHEAAS